MKDDIPWEAECDSAAVAFGRKCRQLVDSNPHEFVALDGIMNTLMTELWDNNFSQTEIRTAFEQALRDMPRYAGGQERRRDGPH